MNMVKEEVGGMNWEVRIDIYIYIYIYTYTTMCKIGNQWEPAI